MPHVDKTLLLLLYLEQILKLVDTEAQLSHAGFEQLPQTVLLHQTHKNTKRLLLGHLGGGQSDEYISLIRYKLNIAYVQHFIIQ